MSNIDTLALELSEAKHTEEAARLLRIDVENRIIAELGVKDEGSQSHKGEQYKITITGKINRTLDVAAWDAVKNHIPEKYWPIKFKPEIDVTGLKWLRENEKGIYATACQAISAKVGKPSVTLEIIKNGN